MDFPQQHEVHFPGNTPPVADTPWCPTAFPHPQQGQHLPSSHSHPVPGQPRGHVGVVRNVADAVVSDAACNHRPDEDWEDMSSSVENTAAQGQPQRYINMGHYAIDNEHPPLHEHHNHAINNLNYAGVSQDVPAQAQAAPPTPEIVIFDDPARDVAAGPVQAFLDERPRQGPVPNGLADEVLRQLAILYLREPSSQVAGIHMEPGHAHGVRVVIVLELTDL